MSDGLAEFLLARIAEDEQSAHIAESMAEEIDLPRALAECEAKRRIVAECQYVREHHFSDDFTADHLAEQVLALLAVHHRGHPDYRPEWAPESDT